jgi:lysozyme family protein
MKTALEARKELQRLVVVDDDGVIGNATMSRIAALRGASADSVWPPAAASADGFQGLPGPLRDEYQRLWDSMIYRWNDDVRDEPGLEAIYQGLRAEFDVVVRTIRANRDRYERISRLVGGAIPWDFVSIIHNMECGLNFGKHLHNGDPLSARTRLVPAGRPVAGSPPFTFEASAIDALTMKGKEFHLVEDWSIPALLHRVEGFNGYGYRKYHPDVLSPYLWSGSNHYTRGKYVADGEWSASAVSKQLGTALILKALRS